MVGGFERYFQIARCFRDEDFRADRQPEFTQLDLEMSFVEEEDVYELVDRADAAACSRSAGIEVSLPLERVTYDEAMLRYGSDRPDRRLGVEIDDLTDVFRGSEFKVFRGAIEARRRRARAARAAASSRAAASTSSRRRRKSLGAKGLAWAVVEDGGWRSPIAKFLSEDEIARATAALEAQRGRRDPVRAPTAPRSPRACWAACARTWPRASRPATTASGSSTSRCSSGTRTRAAGTRCTTRSPRRAATSTRDPGTLALARLRRGARRLGARRRLDPDQPPRRAAEGLRRARHRRRRRRSERFGFLLEALTYGAPPHGGIAFGIDRIVALLAGRESIRDAIAFPKAASGADPLTGAPAPVGRAPAARAGRAGGSGRRADSSALTAAIHASYVAGGGGSISAPRRWKNAPNEPAKKATAEIA